MIDGLLHKMRQGLDHFPAIFHDPLIDVHNSVWDRLVKVGSHGSATFENT